MATLVPAAPVSGEVVEAEKRRAAAETLLRREEVLDARNRLCGYRFSCTGGEAESRFLEALGHIDVARFAQRRLALVPLSARALREKAYRPLQGRQTVFLLDIGREELTPEEWLPLLEELKAKEARICLKGLTPQPEHAALAARADLALLDMGEYELSRFQQLARGLQRAAPHLELVAENVPTWPERRMCGAWGFNYCLGPFSTQTDSEEPEGELDQSRLVVMEMLNLIRADADPTDIGEAAKKDPGIALKVLALANSPAAGLSSPVASLEQAIIVLGRQRLYRWLTVAMFRVGETRERDEALLEVALTRARFLETVAEDVLEKKDCDELFLVGLLSLFDVLLAMPLEKVLTMMNLADQVTAVLLRSEGPYARFLQLALAVERGAAPQANNLATVLGIAPESLNATSRMALAWAEEALGISTSSDL